eukprot:14773130-Alexandrium_andersonii.AAC.1
MRPPARAIPTPHGACSKRSLHMQSPAVPRTAAGTIMMNPTAMMVEPSLLEALVRGPCGRRRDSGLC